MLRVATSEIHSEIDKQFSTNFAADPMLYSDFLSRSAIAVFGIEAVLEEADIWKLLPDWDRRRRSEALRTDLRLLEREFPEAESQRARC